jgi:formylglycine-generating enzyme required for sulfatase activity
MDSTEVTVAHWGACVRSGSCPSAPTTVDWAGITDAQRKLGAACNGNRADRQNHPINCVDRNQATTFCGAYGKRLPTEEEWEYAAGGGSEHRKFPWGDEAPGPTLINACGSECVDWATSIGLDWSAMFTQSDGWETTAPVGSFPRGRTPQGLSDMAGNVWEWTSSNYAKSYNSNEFTDFCVNRGGGWADDDPSYLRAANRLRNAPTSRGYTLGFRCAR